MQVSLLGSLDGLACTYLKEKHLLLGVHKHRGYIQNLEDFTVSVNYNCVCNLIERYSLTEFSAELYRGVSLGEKKKKGFMQYHSVCQLLA